MEMYRLELVFIDGKSGDLFLQTENFFTSHTFMEAKLYKVPA